jgi:hypothetical protein
MKKSNLINYFLSFAFIIHVDLKLRNDDRRKAATFCFLVRNHCRVQYQKTRSNDYVILIFF